MPDLSAAVETAISDLYHEIVELEKILEGKRAEMRRLQAAKSALVPKSKINPLKNKEGTVTHAILDVLAGFPSGATSRQVREALATRGVFPGASLSPQLTALKKRGDILRDGNLLIPVAPLAVAAE